MERPASDTTTPVPDSTLKSEVKRTERVAILNALKLARGNKVEAAKILKVSYKTLFNKIHEHNIQFKTDVE
jgi:DNA-binding NtrC family response regulator